MLTIHMKGRHLRSDGITCTLGLNELFRTLRVVSEVPFIEPCPGLLINLQHVERFDLDTEPELTTEEARAALEDEQEPEQFGNWGPGQPRPRPLDVPRRPGGGAAQWREG